MKKAYFEMRHEVGFEDTNLVGNVYFANHLRWQGKCREMFLRTHAHSVLKELNQGLALVTVRVSCDYFHELFAFDEVILRMSVGSIYQNRITMLFEYLRVGTEPPVAMGEQVVACMRREGSNVVATEIPVDLHNALREFGGQ